MPYLLPQAADNGLLDISGDNTVVIKIGTDEWFTWLRSSDTKSFRFTLGFSNRQSYTVRKEFSKTDEDYKTPHWYGYKRKNKILRKAYLGLTSALTLHRLIEIGHYLWETDVTQFVQTDTDYGLPSQIDFPEGYFWETSTKHAICLELLDEFCKLNNVQTDKVRAYWLSKFKNFLLGKHDKIEAARLSGIETPIDAAVLSPRSKKNWDNLMDM